MKMRNILIFKWYSRSFRKTKWYSMV